MIANGAKSKAQRPGSAMTLFMPSNGEVEGPDDHAGEAPREHNFFRARGAKAQTVHGPLQRLLDGAMSGS